MAGTKKDKSTEAVGEDTASDIVDAEVIEEEVQSTELGSKETQEPETVKSRTGIIPLVFASVVGGLIGAGVGFYASTYYSQQSTAALAGEITKLETALSEDRAKLSVVEDQLLATITPDDIGALQTELSELVATGTKQTAGTIEKLQILEARLAEMAAQQDAQREVLSGLDASSGDSLDAAILASIRQELDQLGASVAGLSGAGQTASAFESRIEELEQEFSSIKSAVDHAAAQSEEVVQLDRLELALSALELSIKSGGNFGGELSAIPSQTDVPDALTISAQNGVGTLAQLQHSFPTAARAGLKAIIKAEADDTLTSKFASYLKGQVSTRSLDAREGDDPDAIMSRAEDALRAGDLGTAIDVLGQLPDQGRAAMADWITQAELRRDTLAAFEAFAASATTTN